LSPAASIAARVAGAVTAFGFALGVVDGPVVGVVGALALIAFGRSLAAPAGTELLGPLAFAVVAGASGIVALRWSSLELAEIRAIQAVLGPTVAVAPDQAAIAAGVALGAAIIAAGIWLADDLADSGLGVVWRWLEVVAVGLVLATLFAGPEAAGVPEFALWAGATAVLSGLVALVRILARPASAGVRLAVVAVTAAAVAAAAGIVGRAG